jgi:hypothetical protein
MNRRGLESRSRRERAGRSKLERELGREGKKDIHPSHTPIRNRKDLAKKNISSSFLDGRISDTV